MSGNGNEKMKTQPIVVLRSSSVGPLYIQQIPCKRLEIVAMRSNVGNVWFQVGKMSSIEHAFSLAPGDSFDDIYVDYLNDVDIHITSANDGVRLKYEL